MKVKCSYCGQYYDDNIAQCPNCGSPNEHLHRTSDAVPKTIEELKQYCEANGFTPERTRFFIGEDYKKPRAFGIYKDDAGEFVVYKNKADGSRAVRYRGKDEAYAVNELYERLQSEDPQPEVPPRRAPETKGREDSPETAEQRDPPRRDLLRHRRGRCQPLHARSGQ